MSEPPPCAKCPTCGRRPSERVGMYEWEVGHDVPYRSLESCPDPIHDHADRAPEIVARLEKGLTEIEACAMSVLTDTFTGDVIERALNCEHADLRNIGRIARMARAALKGQP